MLTSSTETMMSKAFILIIILAIVTFWIYPWDEELNEDALVGKNVLVTGASSGIGEETAYQFAKHGANVVITARRENLLKKVVENCKKLGRKNAKFTYIATDVIAKDATKLIIGETIEYLGSLDYIILNHAIIPPLNPWTSQLDDLELMDKVMNINFRSYLSLASAAIPYLNQTQGSIHVVSSAAGRLSSAFFLPYSSSKWALEGFFAGLREEFNIRKINISITISVFGMIDTEGAREALKNPEMAYGITFEEMIKTFPMGNATEAAYLLMKASALRQRELFYPPGLLVKPLVKLYGLAPNLYDTLLSYMTNTS